METPREQQPQINEPVTTGAIIESWPLLSPEERSTAFKLLDRFSADDFFLSLSSSDQADLVLSMPPVERRSWMRLLAPDDAADVIQHAPIEERQSLLSALDDVTRHEVTALLAYAEDEAGGLMNPRYPRVRPDMTVDEAISYVRRQTREYLHSLYYIYVLDEQQHLRGVVSLWEMLKAAPNTLVRDVMRQNVVTVTNVEDQEEVSRVFESKRLMAIPVVDEDGRMKGVVTADDIVDVVQEEATEDIQKIGGTEALDEPYLKVSMFSMIKKRAGWLSVLFLGEMLTTTAMGHFEEEIARAVVLAIFVPLIISSGGNSGSQATTLIIRAMALSEVTLRDWWRVIRREFFSGLSLGSILGGIGMARILLWQGLFGTYGDHAALIALTVGLSLVGVVLWGTLSGSMLPFALRRLGYDPANASAPFVATLVDVSGLVIYFTIASIVLRGTLL